MKCRLDHNQMRWILVCWMTCLPTIAKGASVNVVDYKPLWRVGQKWDVEVETMTQRPPTASRVKKEFVSRKITRGYAFEVEAIEEVEGELCYRIRMQSVMMMIDGNEVKGAPRQRRSFYKIFNRADDYSLKMLQKLDVSTGKMEASQKYPRGPAHATDWVGFLPLEFPVFSKEAARFSPPVPSEPNVPVVGKGIQSWQKYERRINI